MPSFTPFSSDTFPLCLITYLSHVVSLVTSLFLSFLHLCFRFISLQCGPLHGPSLQCGPLHGPSLQCGPLHGPSLCLLSGFIRGPAGPFPEAQWRSTGRSSEAQRRSPEAQRRSPEDQRCSPEDQRRSPEAQWRSPGRVPEAQRRSPGAQRRSPEAQLPLADPRPPPVWVFFHLSFPCLVSPSVSIALSSLVSPHPPYSSSPVSPLVSPHPPYSSTLPLHALILIRLNAFIHPFSSDTFPLCLTCTYLSHVVSLVTSLFLSLLHLCFRLILAHSLDYCFSLHSLFIWLD